jgi:hypothetical protein
MVRGCYALTQPPSWRTTLYRLPAIAYSKYSQLPSILEAVPPSATWGRTIPCGQGPTYHMADSYYFGNIVQTFTAHFTLSP